MSGPTYTPAELFEGAKRALQVRGMSLAQVNKIIASTPTTAGKIKDLTALSAKVYREQHGQAPTPEEHKSFLARALSGAAGLAHDVGALASGNPGAAATTAAQIAASPTTGTHAAEIGAIDAGTFGLAGALQGGDAYKQAVAAAYGAHPIAAGIGATVGGTLPALLMPEIGIPSTLEEAAKARTLARVGVTALRGAAGGGVLSGAEAAGHGASLPEIGLATGGGALFGGGLGAAAGILGDVIGNTAQIRAGKAQAETLRPLATADELAIKEKIPTREDLAQTVRSGRGPSGPAGGPDLDAMLKAQKAHTSEVRAQVYKPMENTPIESEEIDKILAGKVGETAREKRAAVQAARSVMGSDLGKRPPTVKELQSIRQDLRGRATKAYGTKASPGNPSEAANYSNAADNLNSAMQDAIPGMAERDAMYHVAKEAERAFSDGTKSMGWGSKANRPSQIEALAAKYAGNPTAEANFRLGQEAYLYDDLIKRGGQLTKADVRKYTSAGMIGRIRSLFGNDTARWNAFQAKVDEAGKAYLKLDEIKAARARLAEIEKAINEARKGRRAAGILGAGLLAAPAIIHGPYETYQYARHLIP